MLSRTTRFIAVGLLMLALASSLQALPSEPQTHPAPGTEAGEFIAAAWEWLVDIFGPHPEDSAREQSAGTAGDHGSQVDPDGNH
jgi:hypothetical protein